MCRKTFPTRYMEWPNSFKKIELSIYFNVLRKKWFLVLLMASHFFKNKIKFIRISAKKCFSHIFCSPAVSSAGHESWLSFSGSNNSNEHLPESNKKYIKKNTVSSQITCILISYIIRLILKRDYLIRIFKKLNLDSLNHTKFLVLPYFSHFM